MKTSRTNKDQLIIQSVFTVNLVSELVRHKFLNTPYYEAMKFQDSFIQEGLKSIGVGNFGCLLMCLYSMLVVAWELREKEARDGFPQGNFEDDFDDAEKFLKKNLKICQNTYKKKYSFLCHLRNAVAHAKVELVDEQKKVIFRDQNPRNKKEMFSAELSLAHAGSLMGQLYKGNLEHINRLKKYEAGLVT